VDQATIARRFHDTVTDLIVNTCARIREATGIETVVLSGGVFMNSLLTEETVKKLRESQFSTFRHSSVPPNDGGLSLGQLVVAASRATGGGRG
jgi:hydrogenase maturation protein HypF